MKHFTPIAALLAGLFYSVGCEQRAIKTDSAAASSPQSADSVTQTIPPASGGMELQTADYREARASFRTRLTRQGPSPQDHEALRAPQGAKLLDYRSDERTLKAIVGPVLSAGQKKPGVVFLHGGFAYADDDWEMSKPYRDAGFIVMTPILRGENGQPGNFSLYYNEVDDVLAATKMLAALPYVDKGRIYIAGHSAGGTLAILVAMTSDRFRAAASLSGTMDQSYLKSQPAPLVCFDMRNIREFQMRSPVSFATSIQSPARLYYGSKEDWAPNQNNRTAMLAKQHGQDVEALMFPGDHFSSVPAGIQDSIAFFRKH